MSVVDERKQKPDQAVAAGEAMVRGFSVGFSGGQEDATPTDVNNARLGK